MRSEYLRRPKGLLTLLAAVALIMLLHVQSTDAQETERQPALWRQLIAGSATVESMFVTRSPQFVLYRNGFIVYRRDNEGQTYRQVQLTDEERVFFVRSLESNYRISGITPNRLGREEPYINSVQGPIDPNNKKTVVLWLGMHNPPSLHRHSEALMIARSGNNDMGPAWNLMYECSNYLSTFDHPRAKKLVPDEIEIAVQALPTYLSEKADSATRWPLKDKPLSVMKGSRNRAFETLTGQDARRAFAFLSEQSIVRDGDQVYEVWVRPILLPK